MRIIKLLVPVLILSLILVGCAQKAGEIKLNTGSVTLKSVGATSKLTATVYDTKGTVIAKLKQPVVWTTSNAAVATVDANGSVKAAGSGTATVTATFSGLSASAKVTVELIKSVTVNPESYNMKIGDTYQFTAVVQDDAGKTLDMPVEWKIGNATIASVTGNGTVKALAGGKTVVKAVAGDKMGKASLTVIEAKEDKDSKIGGMKKKGDKKEPEKKKAAGMKKKGK